MSIDVTSVWEKLAQLPASVLGCSNLEKREIWNIAFGHRNNPDYNIDAAGRNFLKKKVENFQKQVGESPRKGSASDLAEMERQVQAFNQVEGNQAEPSDSLVHPYLAIAGVAQKILAPPPPPLLSAAI